jgi:hypothetical protein
VNKAGLHFCVTNNSLTQKIKKMQQANETLAFESSENQLTSMSGSDSMAGDLRQVNVDGVEAIFFQNNDKTILVQMPEQMPSANAGISPASINIVTGITASAGTVIPPTITGVTPFAAPVLNLVQQYFSIQCKYQYTC